MHHNTPLVSIAMATYNGEKYIEEQLDSIFAQTYKNIEVIVCDDQSLDKTVQILEKYKTKYGLEYTINSQRLGSVKNFEQTLLKCSGKYIAFADQDDIWHPEKLTNLVDVIAKKDLFYIFSNACLIDDKSTPLLGTLWDKMAFSYTERRNFNLSNENQIDILLKKNIVFGMSMLFKKELLDIILPISEYHSHDNWISTIASITKHTGYAVDKPLIDYRQHENQVCGANKSSFKDKITNIMHVDSTSYLRELQAFNDMRNQIMRLPIEYDFRKLDDKILHLNNRMQIRESNVLKKILLIFKEINSRRYNLYSKGIISILRDLLHYKLSSNI